jgi:hypothetical protein
VSRRWGRQWHIVDVVGFPMAGQWAHG